MRDVQPAINNFMIHGKVIEELYVILALVKSEITLINNPIVIKTVNQENIA